MDKTGTVDRFFGMPAGLPIPAGGNLCYSAPESKTKPCLDGLLKGALCMRSIAPMRAAKIGYLVISAALCVLGLVLILYPAFSASALGVICGILLIVFGCVKLVGFFSKDLYRLAFQYDLLFGILLMALGIALLARPVYLMNFLSVMLGLSILTDGLFKTQIAMDAKAFGIRLWWLVLAAAVLACILGGTLIFRPGEGSYALTIWLGIALLAEGVLNMSTIITTVKIIRHQQPDGMDS